MTKSGGYEDGVLDSAARTPGRYPESSSGARAACPAPFNLLDGVYRLTIAVPGARLNEIVTDGN